MLRKISLIFVLFLVCVFAMLSSLSLPLVHADTLHQGTPRLDHYQIYFTEANNEASRFDHSDAGLSRLAGLLQQLGADLHTLEWREPIPPDADLVIMVDPDDLSSEQVVRLWLYLHNNGRLLLLTEPPPVRVMANGRIRVQGLSSDSDLFQLMQTDMGMRARNDIVGTEGSPQLIVPTPGPAAEEGQATSTPAPSYELPELLVNFTSSSIETDSPLTSGIESELAFFGARSLEIDISTQGIRPARLIFTDRYFYGETDLNTYHTHGLGGYDLYADTEQGRQTLAAAFENTTSGTRVVLMGDREFTTNGTGFQTSPPDSAAFVYPGNVRFLINAIAWLLNNDPVTLSFPTPVPTATATPSLTQTPEAE